jgi:type I restriction enzyme, S subunit
MGIKKIGRSRGIQVCYNGKASSDETGKPYLRITDINFDGSLKSERVYVQISNDDFQKYSLQTNDIVIARTGATVGKSFLFTENEVFAFASYLIRYRFDQSKILPKFVSYLLRSSSFWNFIGLKQTVGAQPNVNATKMS